MFFFHCIKGGGNVFIIFFIIRVMKVLIFGNVLVEGDDLALKLIPELEEKFDDIEFKEFDPTEDLQKEGRNLLIIDAVIGIDSVKELVLRGGDDFERVELSSGVGMHDFDLGYNLRLLSNLGLIDGVKIICVPIIVKNKERVLEDIVRILNTWINSN